MKANQKFTQADEAVSPVIGVILMVAITVVLAAVVFVLVSDLGDSGESAPNISFSKNAGDKTITVVQAESGILWGDLELGGTGSCTNGNTGTSSVNAGDQLTDCSGGSITIRHIATNSLIYSTTFT